LTYVGPAVGPIAGGFLVQYAGTAVLHIWIRQPTRYSLGPKYVFIVIVGLSALAGTLALPFLHETYAPVLRFRLAKASGDPEKAARVHPVLSKEHGGKGHLLWVNLTRPIILLTRNYVCFMLSGYTAFVYGMHSFLLRPSSKACFRHILPDVCYLCSSVILFNVCHGFLTPFRPFSRDVRVREFRIFILNLLQHQNLVFNPDPEVQLIWGWGWASWPPQYLEQSLPIVPIVQ
jgi:MFS family permease